MKETNLNPLFIDLIRNFSHLITRNPQTKKRISNNYKKYLLFD